MTIVLMSGCRQTQWHQHHGHASLHGRRRGAGAYRWARQRHHHGDGYRSPSSGAASSTMQSYPSATTTTATTAQSMADGLVETV